MNTQDSQNELNLIRNVFDELNLVFPTGDIITLSEENEKAFEAYITTRVKEAEDTLIDKSHKPCECGREHFGTPVRSVKGNITTYCQFSRVVLQEALTATTNGEEKSNE